MADKLGRANGGESDEEYIKLSFGGTDPIKRAQSVLNSAESDQTEVVGVEVKVTMVPVETELPEEPETPAPEIEATVGAETDGGAKSKSTKSAYRSKQGPDKRGGFQAPGPDRTGLDLKELAFVPDSRAHKCALVMDEERDWMTSKEIAEAADDDDVSSISASLSVMEGRGLVEHKKHENQAAYDWRITRMGREELADVKLYKRMESDD